MKKAKMFPTGNSLQLQESHSILGNSSGDVMSGQNDTDVSTFPNSRKVKSFHLFCATEFARR